MKRIINTTTGATIWRGADYLVDGQPGEVEAPLVLLTEVTPDLPTYDEETQRLVGIPDAIDGETYVRGAVEIVDLTIEEVAARNRRELSKLVLMKRLDALGKWEAFKALITQMNGKTKDGWDLAQFIASDHPLFVQGAPQIKAALGLSDEQFASLLA